MNILQNHSANNNILKTKNIFGTKQPKIEFHEKLSSTDLEQHFFTNFIDSRRDPMVKFLKNERRKMLTDKCNFDDEYEIKNIEYRKNEKEKIKDILEQTIGDSNIDYNLLIRLKSKENKGVQFFFLDKEATCKVLIIDLYHLLLPAPNKEIGETKANPEKNYSKHKDAKFNLSNIFGK